MSETPKKHRGGRPKGSGPDNLRIGDRVYPAGVPVGSDEYDTGTVTAIEGEDVTVAWELAGEVYKEPREELARAPRTRGPDKKPRKRRASERRFTASITVRCTPEQKAQWMAGGDAELSFPENVRQALDAALR